jgi:multisubunit Na+/H+ antiporter MnhB subunit
MRRFTTRSLLVGTTLFAICATVATHSVAGALALLSLLATGPVVAVAYLAIRREQASWAIWLAWPVLAACAFWILGIYVSRILDA